jgi:hypothetical protein
MRQQHYCRNIYTLLSKPDQDFEACIQRNGGNFQIIYDVYAATVYFFGFFNVFIHKITRLCGT